MFFKTGTCFYASPTPASSAKVYSPPPLTPPNPTPSLSIYYLTLIKKPDAPTVEVKLVDYLTSALNLPGSSVISGIYYDTRQGDPFDTSTGGKFNSSYYLITSVSLLPGTIDNYAASIDIKPIDIGLLPFLNDPLYCDTSLDCTIRDNFCATGAFNFFHPFSDGWLCRRQTDPQGGSLIIYDQDKQCRAQKEFAVPQCLDHRCTAAQVITQCIN